MVEFCKIFAKFDYLFFYSEKMMEVRFIYKSRSENRKLHKAISRKLFCTNSYVKWINYADVFLLFGYMSLLLYLYVNLSDWTYSFEEYYGNNYISYGLHIAIYGFLFVMIYAQQLRPYLLNKSVEKISKGFLSGEVIIRLQDNGIFQKNQRVESLYYYHSIQEIVHLENHLVILLGGHFFIAISYDDFESNEQRAAFETFIKQKMGA